MIEKLVVTNEDLTGGADEITFDRNAPPIDVEQVDLDVPEQRPAAQIKTHTLQDMAKDYEFFTTGVIHATTGIDRDPVTEFLRANPNASQPLVIDSAEPFFSGLGVLNVVGQTIDFDRRLYAVPREDWDSIRDFISGIAVINQATGFFAKIGFHEITMVDVFGLKKTNTNTIPVVPVTSFGVSSNVAFYLLSDPPPPTRPALLTLPPTENNELAAAIKKLS